MKQSAVNEYWADVVARYRASPLPGFVRWWRGELSSLIPESVRQRLVQPRPVLWLVPDMDSGEMAVWAGGEEPEQLDVFGAAEDAELLRDRWMALVRDFEDGNPEIRLCLPESEVLQCPVELPLAVESGLDQALRYQLDQLTPFQADQVYYDHEVLTRDAEHGRLKLELRLVPIARIEGLRDRLAAIGIRPHAVDVIRSGEQPASQGFNLLPEDERPTYVYARARLNWRLAGAAALLLALVMAQSLYLRGQTVDRLQAEVDNLRSESEAVVALQQQLEDSLAAANFLAERRRRQPVTIQVLDEVTRVLPDDIWLQQLQVRGNELNMQGLADGSQRLIELINDSELLTDAEFRGSVNIDPASGRERFNALARIRTGRALNAAAAESGE
jgi:general secretion pathway protein L